MKKLSTEKKVTVSLAATLIFLSFMSAVTYWSITRLNELAAQVTQSNQIIERLELLLSDLKDAETGQRGYILTGSEEYLKPHLMGVEATNQELQQLRQIIDNDPNQQQRLHKLEPLIATKLAELSQTIQLRKTEGFAAALEVVQTNQGKQAMDAIRGVVSEMKANEQQRLQYQQLQRQRQTQIVTGVVGIGGLLAFTLVPLAIFAINRDLLKRKQAEALVVESEERFRQLSEATFEAIAITENGKVIDANSRFVQLFGYEIYEAIGKQMADFYPPQWMDLVKQKIAINDECCYEIEGLCKNGMTFPLEVRDRVISYKGQTVRVVAIRDMTEAKKAEALLRKSEATNRALVKAIPDLMIRYSRNGNYLDIMPAKNFHLINPQSDRIGKNILDVMSPELAQQRLHYIEQAFQTGEAQTYEFPVQLEDGLHYQEARITVSGEDEVLTIVRDISDRKLAEQALQQANQKLIDSVKQLEERNQEIALLASLSDMLQVCLTIDEAYRALAELVQPLFPEVAGGVFVISASKHLVEVVASWGDKALLSQAMFTPNECWALRRGRSHLVSSDQPGMRCQHIYKPFEAADGASAIHAAAPAETLCVPMMAQGDALGVVYLATAQRGWFTHAKEQLAVTVSEHIALALANLKLREALQQQSIRDALTGLFNRRYMEESLERELRRAERKQQSLGIIIFDVDYFKRLNDTYGHEAGDTVLRELGLFIQSQIRGSDIGCRYGGEEFLLILPEASLEVTRQRAEQIREGFKHLNLQNRRQPLGTVTMSLGVAVFPKHGLTGAAVIQAADAALYRAKHEGRDRVVSAISLS